MKLAHLCPFLGDWNWLSLSTAELSPSSSSSSGFPFVQVFIGDIAPNTFKARFLYGKLFPSLILLILTFMSSSPFHIMYWKSLSFLLYSIKILSTEAVGSRAILGIKVVVWKSFNAAFAALLWISVITHGSSLIQQLSHL